VAILTLWPVRSSIGFLISFYSHLYYYTSYFVAVFGRQISMNTVHRRQALSDLIILV